LNGNDLKNCISKNGSNRWTFSSTNSYFELSCKCKLDTKYTFMDYITGGMEMNFVVAVDFTASNGSPTNPTSLHYNSPNQFSRPNQYVQAIKAVGDIVQDYDTDKLFPVYGFGARIPPQGQVSHMFPCNFNYQNPFVERVDGILQIYKDSLSKIQLYGPTNFAPVITQCANMAREETREGNNDAFFVLLILTDGVITDMDATKKTIIDNSNLPFSIIIVGVGDADFSLMDELDSDDHLLSFGGKTAVRDIVQFVPYKDFIGHGNDIQVQTALASSVLEEVPGQVSAYMFDNKILPKNFDAPPPY